MTNSKIKPFTASYGLTKPLSSTDPANLLRGQIVARETGNHVAFVGIFEGECPLPPEKLYRATQTPQCHEPGEMLFIRSFETPNPAYSYVDDFKSTEIGDLLTRKMWSLFETDTASMQLYLRRSTHEGDTPVMMFAGIISDNKDTPILSMERMHNVTLDLDTGKLVILPSDTPMHQEILNCRGHSITQILKAHLWGFDDEPWGHISTMEHDFIHRATELKRLSLRDEFGIGPSLTKSEKARVKELQECWHLSSLVPDHKKKDREKGFKAFLKYHLENFGMNSAHTFTGTRNVSQQKEYNLQIKETIAKTMDTADA